MLKALRAAASLLVACAPIATLGCQSAADEDVSDGDNALSGDGQAEHALVLSGAGGLTVRLGAMTTGRLPLELMRGEATMKASCSIVDFDNGLDISCTAIDPKAKPVDRSLQFSLKNRSGALVIEQVSNTLVATTTQAEVFGFTQAAMQTAKIAIALKQESNSLEAFENPLALHDRAVTASRLLIGKKLPTKGSGPVVIKRIRLVYTADRKFHTTWDADSARFNDGVQREVFLAQDLPLTSGDRLIEASVLASQLEKQIADTIVDCAHQGDLDCLGTPGGFMTPGRT